MSGKFALYCCENSAGLAVETVSDADLLDRFEVVLLPCSGRIETTLLLKTLERGYQGAIVLGCPEENCKFVSGNKRAARCVGEARRALDGAGLDSKSIRMEYVSSVDTYKVEAIMRDMIERNQTVIQAECEERG